MTRPSRAKPRPPVNECYVEFLRVNGYVPVKNHPDYVINPKGIVYRVTAPKQGPIVSYPRMLKPKDFSPRNKGKHLGYSLAAPPPWKRVRHATIATLLRENFGGENAAPLP